MQRLLFAGLLISSVVATRAAAEDKVEPTIPPKHKAIAIRLDPADKADFILPGAKVDVLWKSADKNAKTKTILTNILVVAVDQTLPAGETPAILTITLAVTEDDGLKVAAARKEGKISLVPHKPAKKEAPAKPTPAK